MRILFLGEGSLDGPARYLAAVLRYAGISFDHRPDGAKIPKAWRQPQYAAIVLSDYRYSSFTPCARDWVECAVTRGTGLLMIGGWASFTGLVGGYSGSSIEKMLPVRCLTKDDRANWASGSVVVRATKHAVSEGLNFKVPPVVCGYHRAETKPGTKTVLSLRDLSLNHEKPSLGKPHPLLVLGQYQEAKTAAFLTDCAPHWAGGLVDWGRRRVRVSVAPDVRVEVGDQYLKFFTRLVRWVGGSL